MRYLHTMLRVRNLETRPLDFYVNKLGLVELRAAWTISTATRWYSWQRPQG